MSQAVFPVMPGLTWDITREPIWSTTVKAAVNGREYRTANWSFPRYKYHMVYSVLRQQGAFAEMAQLAGFFNARQGSFDSFLFTDPDDNAVVAQQFGTGDSATTAFQLLRTFGGYVEPVFDLTGGFAIFRNDWQGNVQLYVFSRTNLVLQSQTIDNAAWTKQNAGTGVLPVVTANFATAPDGTATAERVQLDKGVGSTSGDQSLMLSPPVTQAASPAYAFSIWLKTNDASTKTVQVSIAGGGATNFSVNGTWQRCTVTLLGAGTFNARVGLLGGALATSQTCDLAAWGAQWESTASISSAPSSYIPTAGATASFTDYSISATALVTFAAAPLVAAVLTWTGSYYRRMRFFADTVQFNQFMQKLWDLKSLELLSVKP